MFGSPLDVNCIKLNNLDKDIKRELDYFNIPEGRLNCIVIDSWNNYEKDNIRILKRISEKYSDLQIVVMQSIDDSKFQKEENNELINRKFELYYLMALSRGAVRNVISQYNNLKYIGDEDIILNKVISDLDLLNIHRTPFNCITLLKVSEKYFDESPVNRTKMLEMVLFLLFNIDIPTYKTKPDLKDCEYVLGCFCEKIIKTNKYTFSRESFVYDLNKYCEEKLIDLEVDLVFEILFNNNIIVKRNSDFVFRFSYWILYFGAHRMHVSTEFSSYVLENENYISYPQIVEFYTGIDRNRVDALNILLQDIKSTCEIVDKKVGLTDAFDPFKYIEWNPSEDSILKLQDELSDDVQSSNLPIEVKDRFADKNYDQTKPYNQNINTILHDFSVVVLMQKIKASSVALRNSDYVKPEIKREMLNQILGSWSQISKLLIALSPMLASRGYAVFEGAGFILAGDFGDTFEERFNKIIRVNPRNVAKLFKDYLYSAKMGPLLYDYFKHEKNDFKRHEIALLIVCQRPRGWKKHIEDYIASVPKNSFYLYDIFSALRVEHKYGFASASELNELKYLIKMGLAKHKLGTKRPGIESIKKISDKVIPQREKE